jgi:methionyl-tRNA formyltransferase
MAERPTAVFMGTPEFAATVLRRLLEPDSPVRVTAAVTQPDKPAGRKQELLPPPVKLLAQQRGIPVLQPPKSRGWRPATLQALRQLGADVGIVAAYGRILPQEVLDIPALGYLNVHASLLPHWRGAWPVGAAILAGNPVTGASIMKLDAGMDTGPVLAKREEPVRPDDTTGSLEPRLAALGADLLVEVLPGYVAGTVPLQAQDDRLATYCHMVRKRDGRLVWSQPAVALERCVRAMQPWPVAFTTWAGKQLRVLKARVVDVAPGQPGGPASDAAPGTVLSLGKGAAVQTGDGLLALEQVQLEGRSVTPIAAFKNGYRDFVGSRLGEPDE